MLHPTGPIIGVDFDNTLVSYDELLLRVALEKGLIRSEDPMTKKQIRDSIRGLPGGEIQWQKLQALVYGPRMAEATPAPGAIAFLRVCTQRNIVVHIVSHKTEFATFDESGTSLRCAALSWINRHRLFDGDHAGLSRSNVHFESTRLEKLERIRRLGCTHFIDDLEETFMERSFPDQVEKILYQPNPEGNIEVDVKLAGGWNEISGYFFHAAD